MHARWVCKRRVVETCDPAGCSPRCASLPSARCSILCCHLLQILKELRHDSLVRLERVFTRPDKHEVDLVYEFAEHDLAEIIKCNRGRHVALITAGDPAAKAGPTDARMLKSILQQVLSGLAFLHKNWCMHRDMKPAVRRAPHPATCTRAETAEAHVREERDKRLSKNERSRCCCCACPALFDRTFWSLESDKEAAKEEESRLVCMMSGTAEPTPTASLSPRTSAC